MTYTLQMPYLNWDQYKHFRSLNRIYTRFQSGETLHPPPDSASYREIIEHGIAPYLKAESGRSLHPRRTLDQFYYSSLGDTRGRDRDQTVSKWTGPGVGADGRANAVDDSLMIMVDQLWCWLLDDSRFYGNILQHPRTDSMHRNYHVMLTIRRHALSSRKRSQAVRSL